jgi:hypothetical protein
VKIAKELLQRNLSLFLFSGEVKTTFCISRNSSGKVIIFLIVIVIIVKMVDALEKLKKKSKLWSIHIDFIVMLLGLSETLINY